MEIVTPRIHRIAVSGATGLVGSALCERLLEEGREVIRLVRSPARGSGEVFWDPSAGDFDAGALDGVDAVVHLAGENIAGRRWNSAFKEVIRKSRVHGTGLLARSLAALRVPPRIFLCSSAVGYYGDRGTEVLTEESAPGEGFLPDVCREWEAAAEPARKVGIRTVHLRFGTVLAARGGALAKMLPAFRLGVGGRVGSGRQFMSWISLEDAVGAIVHLLSGADSGPFNAVAPQAVTNGEFASTLGRILHRPTFFPLPAAIVRAALGEMGESLLLSSCHAVPERLLASGFVFVKPSLEGALRWELGRHE
jgi:uncharacterized protein (TIGR01777 family)